MDYSSPVRRRVRAVRRIAYAASLRSMWSGGHVVPAFWWDGHPNFGDDITPWLLPRYGVLPILRPPDSAQFAGAGSILGFLPSDYEGVIWGSGLMEGEEHPLPASRVLAVRGPLSAELIGVRHPVAFGDPGILVARHMTRPRERWALGIVPHGHHRQHPALAAVARRGGEHAHVINVHQSAASAVREIASCGVILTTSLHGLITADAFGIPAAWTALEPALNGGDFKFRDYEAGITPGGTRYMPVDETVSPEAVVRSARRVDAETIARITGRLEETLSHLVDELGALPTFPAGVEPALRM